MLITDTTHSPIYKTNTGDDHLLCTHWYPESWFLNNLSHQLIPVQFDWEVYSLLWKKFQKLKQCTHLCIHDDYLWEVEMTTATSWQECGLLCCSEWLALNVYVALCYCNLDFYDVSLEILDMYLQVGRHAQSCWILLGPYRETLPSMKLTTLSSALTSTLFQLKIFVSLLYQVHPESPLAVNVKVQFVISSLCGLDVSLCSFGLFPWDVTRSRYLHWPIISRCQACNNYKLYDGKAAEADFKALKSPVENDLVKHNLVVFKDGDSALQVCLPVSLWHSWLYHYCRPKLQSSI